MSLLIWQYLHCAQTLPTHQPLNYRVVCYCMLWHYMKKLVVRRKNCPVNHLLRSNLFQHGHHPSCPSNPETEKLLSDATGNQHLMSTNSYWAHFLALCGRGCVAPRRLHRAWQERGEGHPKSGLDWSDGMWTLHRLIHGWQPSETIKPDGWMTIFWPFPHSRFGHLQCPKRKSKTISEYKHSPN